MEAVTGPAGTRPLACGAAAPWDSRCSPTGKRAKVSSEPLRPGWGLHAHAARVTMAACDGRGESGVGRTSAGEADEREGPRQGTTQVSS